jgi:hypothetical protein
MTHMHLGRRPVRKLHGLLALWVTCVTSASAQTTGPVCTAVASSNNALYLVSQSGSLVSQLLTDSLPKLSVAIAPEANKVAYIPSTNPQTFTIVDTTGRAVTTTLPTSLTSVFTAVSWDAQNVLKAQSHVGQRTDMFSFYSAPGAATVSLQEPVNIATGEVCAAPPGNNGTACIRGNTVVAGDKVVYSENLFAPGSSTAIASVSIPVGGTVASPGTPSFQLQVLSIAEGVTLKVGLPTGNWIQSRVVSGAAIPLNLDDIVYGFVPTITDVIKGTVRVDVLQSAFGAGPFDPAISWRDGAHIGVLERKTTGAQLLLINRNGNTSSAILGAFNIQEPVIALNFDTPSLLVFKTLQRFGVVPVTITTSANGATLVLGAITDLPLSISATLPTGPATVPVLGWSCQ